MAVFLSFRRWFWALGLDFGFGPELLSASGMSSGLGLGFRLWAGAHARNGTTPSFSPRGNVLAGCKNGVHSSHVASSFQKPDVSAVIFGKGAKKIGSCARWIASEQIIFNGSGWHLPGGKWN